MKRFMGNTEDILNSQISGFHQYVLNKPVHLSYVSQNLCDMTGYSQKELLGSSLDGYASLIYSADKNRYHAFLHKLAREKQTLTLQYRIVRKDGCILYLSDTITTERLPDGTLVGNSVLTDITAIKSENSNLRFINETIPCGLVKYTCEKHPRVTYVNDQLLSILRFPKVRDGELDYIEFYKTNIYLVIPMEERRKFSHFLNQVYTKGAPIVGELSVLRCDGTKARLYGWVTKVINEEGKEEFQSVCMDVTESYRSQRASETEQYLKALSEVYDMIFEYDFANKTVRYVHDIRSPAAGKLQNVPMHMEEATDQWIQNTVVREDRAEVQKFFQKISERQFTLNGSRPPQIRFRGMTPDGEIRNYCGVFLKIDVSITLFCCRSLPDEQEADQLRSENLSLKSINESMKNLVMRFTEGIVAFEVKNGTVKPLYASDNVCRFFGYTKEEWLSMSQKSHSIADFISQSHLDQEDVARLLSTGEAEFTYFDIAQNTVRRIKAICSKTDGFSPRYVMLYNMDNTASLPREKASNNSRIYIRTFGYFDVFVDDKPIAFRNKKSKELFALLVDRRGGYVSSEEAISFLWEDEAVNAVTLSRYRKVALRLKNILEEYGITNVIESIDGKRRIVTEKVRCDLYDYLSQKEEFAQLFKGSYLTNYSWGETTLGELLNEHAYQP